MIAARMRYFDEHWWYQPNDQEAGEGVGDYGFAYSHGSGEGASVNHYGMVASTNGHGWGLLHDSYGDCLWDIDGGLAEVWVIAKMLEAGRSF